MATKHSIFIICSCDFSKLGRRHTQECAAGTQMDSLLFPVCYFALCKSPTWRARKEEKQQSPTVLDLKAFNDTPYI